MKNFPPFFNFDESDFCYLGIVQITVTENGKDGLPEIALIKVFDTQPCPDRLGWIHPALVSYSNS